MNETNLEIILRIIIFAQKHIMPRIPASQAYRQAFRIRITAVLLWTIFRPVTNYPAGRAISCLQKMKGNQYDEYTIRL
jgi:hypothetical protein